MFTQQRHECLISSEFCFSNGIYQTNPFLDGEGISVVRLLIPIFASGVNGRVITWFQGGTPFEWQLKAGTVQMAF